MEIPYRILVLGDFAARPDDLQDIARRADGTTFLPLLKEFTGRPRLDFADADRDSLRLEAAWRGLHFLIRRVDLKADIVVDILPSSETDALDRLSRLARREGAGIDAIPIGLVVAAWTFAPGDGALEFFAAAAETARLAVAPLLAGVDLATMERLTGDPEWALRRKTEAFAYLGLAANRFLLREEGPGAPLYGSPALILAVVAARSFKAHGRPTEFSGAVVEDLPIHETKDGFIPTECLLSPERVASLVDHGATPLVVAKNRDQVRLVNSPSAHPDLALFNRLTTTRAPKPGKERE